jgi:NADH-quinone oxidoreductase subunit G
VGSNNVDFRTRQSDFALDGKVTPWLGMSITEFGSLNRAFVIGSFLRKDHPLLAARLRQAVKSGAKVSVLHATDDDLLMPVANKMIKAPSAWLAALGEVIAAVAAAKGIAAPAGYESIEPSEAAKQTAASLLSGEHKAILLGNAVAQHPQASQLHIAAQWIAHNTEARLGYLTEAANTVGGYLAKATPGEGGANAAQMFAEPRKAYLLLNAEPELDSANPQAARAALDAADMVVVMSPFRHGADYADVMLPITPFTETSGTFVNCEGRAQSFNGTVRPAGDSRPGWKVLRVLGNLLDLDGFDYDTSEAIRNQVLACDKLADANLTGHLNNHTTQILHGVPAASSDLERVADVPIYSTDGVVRRAESLQLTADAQAPKAYLSSALAQKLGIEDGAQVRVKQGNGSALLAAAVDRKLPDNVVRIAAGHASTAALGAMFGAIAVERA